MSGAASGLRCDRPVHKACKCIRPPDHDGDCNCVYRNGTPVVHLDPRPEPDVDLDEPNSPDRAFLAVALTMFLTVLVMAGIGIWVDVTGGG